MSQHYRPSDFAPSAPAGSPRGLTIFRDIWLTLASVAVVAVVVFAFAYLILLGNSVDKLSTDATTVTSPTQSAPVTEQYCEIFPDDPQC